MLELDTATIDVYIDQEGKVRVEVSGMKGGGCTMLTAKLEQALGGEIQSREMKTEAYEVIAQEVAQLLKR